MPPKGNRGKFRQPSKQKSIPMEIAGPTPGEAMVNLTMDSVEEEETLTNPTEENQDSDAGSSGKKQQPQVYCFTTEEEEKLVEFFSGHQCFYNKASSLYSNTRYKNTLIEGIANDIGADGEKIIGWFKTQRTAVGKIYKKKSGQAAESMTARKKWQLANFNFLKQYIMPRTYTKDSGLLPNSKASDSEEEEEVVDVEGDDIEEDGSDSFQQRQSHSKKPRKQVKNSKFESAFMNYMSKPRTSEALAKKIEALDSAPPDERKAFGQWFCARITKVPEARWDDFHDEIQRVVREYTRADRQTSQSSTQATTIPSTYIPSQQLQQQQIGQRSSWQLPQPQWQHLQQQWQQTQQAQQQYHLQSQNPSSYLGATGTFTSQIAQPLRPQSVDATSLSLSPWTADSIFKMLSSQPPRTAANDQPAPAAVAPQTEAEEDHRVD